MEDMKKITEELEDLRKIVATLQVHSPRQVESQVISNTLSSIPSVEKFSFEKSDWEQWIAHYGRYRIISGMDRAEQKLQITNLLLHMGPEVGKLLEKLKKTEESLQTYEEVKTLFETHFSGKKNIIYERAKFNLRQQHEGETAREYIESLQKLSKSCDYGTLVDELIRDRIVVGIRDNKLSEHLQLDEQLTLEKAIEKVTQSEMIKEQNKEIREQLLAGTGKQIDKINQYRSKYKYKRSESSSNEKKEEQIHITVHKMWCNSNSSI